MQPNGVHKHIKQMKRGVLFNGATEKEYWP